MKNGQSRENGSQWPSADTNGTGGRYNCSPGVDKKFRTLGEIPTYILLREFLGAKNGTKKKKT